MLSKVISALVAPALASAATSRAYSCIDMRRIAASRSGPSKREGMG
jgi:hypothetical protein